jgi:hypothetical protein
MDTTKLIRDLRAEKGRIERAIAALEVLGNAGAGSRTARTATASRGAAAGRRKMSPAARKRISEMMKKRWAARRKAAKKA